MQNIGTIVSIAGTIALLSRVFYYGNVRVVSFSKAPDAPCMKLNSSRVMQHRDGAKSAQYSDTIREETRRFAVVSVFSNPSCRFC